MLHLKKKKVMQKPFYSKIIALSIEKKYYYKHLLFFIMCDWKYLIYQWKYLISETNIKIWNSKISPEHFFFLIKMVYVKQYNQWKFFKTKRILQIYYA